LKIEFKNADVTAKCTEPEQYPDVGLTARSSRGVFQ